MSPSSEKTVLVIEDDRNTATLVALYLKREGFRVLTAGDGEAGLSLAERHRPNLVILDLMLPKADGWEVCRRLRQKSEVPIIMLTARAEEIDRVSGLTLGADDYMVKPFSPRELVARVRTVLRRTRRPAAAAPPAAGFEVDDERKLIRFRGTALDLSRIEYRLLKVLIERPGRVFSRDELMQRAWDDPGASFDRTVDAHVKTLRAKLRAVAPDEDPIVTHRGMGYSLREQR